jgi:hypothetical protein
MSKEAIAVGRLEVQLRRRASARLPKGRLRLSAGVMPSTEIPVEKASLVRG